MLGKELSSSFQCMGCHLIVGGIKKVVGIASSTAIDWSSLICNRLFLLKSFCRSIVGGSINEIVKAVKEGMNSDAMHKSVACVHKTKNCF